MESAARRPFRLPAAALALAVLGAAGAGDAAASDPFAAGALAADVAAYFEFGDHRAGTEADRRTVEWLAGRLGELGFQAQRRRYRELV